MALGQIMNLGKLARLLALLQLTALISVYLILTWHDYSTSGALAETPSLNHEQLATAFRHRLWERGISFSFLIVLFISLGWLLRHFHQRLIQAEEERLREQERYDREERKHKTSDLERQKFLSLAEQSTEFIGIYDLEFHPLFINEAGRQLLGFTCKDEECQPPLLDLFFPEDRTFLQNEFFPQLHKNGRCELEIRLRHLQTGEAIWMWYNLFYLRNSEGIPVGLATVSHNITERKVASEKLRLNEERLRLALNAAHLGTWDWDIPRNVVIWNDELYRMFGYEPDSFTPNNDHWKSRVHPDDAQESEARIIQALEQGIEYQDEFRVVHPHNEVRILRAHGHVVRNEAGETLRMYGVMMDITVQQRLMDELHQTKDELELRVADRTDQLAAISQEMAIILDHAPVCVFKVIDRKQVWANKQAEDMFLYSRNELVGESIRKLHVSDTAYEQIELDIYPILAQGETAEIIQEMVRKDGVFIWVRCIGRALEPHDLSSGIIWLMEDITESKKQQQALKESQALLMTIIDSTEDMIWAVEPETYCLTEFNKGVVDHFLKHYGVRVQRGMLLQEMFPNGDRAYHMEKQYKRAVTEGSFQTEYATASGNTLLELRFNPLKRDETIFGLAVFGKDVTLRTRQEIAQQQLILRNKKLLAVAQDGIHILDMSGNLIESNAAFRQMLGYLETDDLPRHVSEWDAEFDTEQIAEIMEDLVWNQRLFETRHRRRDGNIIDVEISASGVLLDGQE
jgi:PAS domain S-box-containing protein